MDKKFKKTLHNQPIEQHTTAPWTNLESRQDVSNVQIPNEDEVRRAKEWVDQNEK